MSPRGCLRRRARTGLLGVAIAALSMACVHVPDSIKQEFRAAEPDETSNFQAARHGSAPPADASDPWSRHFAEQAARAQAEASAKEAQEELARCERTPDECKLAPLGPPTTDAGAPEPDGATP